MKLDFNQAFFSQQKLLPIPFIIYGMGYVGNLIAEWCNNNRIDYIFCDRNAEQKKNKTDKMVIFPEQLKEYPDSKIVIASINYYDEIKSKLEQLGIDSSRIFSYLDFWTDRIDWDKLENTADWGKVRQRAEIFASWIAPSAQSVADYSFEKNFLRDFLPKTIRYESPDYIRFQNNIPYGDFSKIDTLFRVDVSSCLAMLMSFSNPEAVIDHMCISTKKAIIASYVVLEKLSDIRFRRSINYNNDYTEQQFVDMFVQRGFQLIKSEQDPFDMVHIVYLFERR
ncbi:MAG: hypothetical protein HFG17_12490 [Oscillospiraceae bacterium]|nr:hypothetical protein [Oscillospiraceae bacterium]